MELFVSRPRCLFCKGYFWCALTEVWSKKGRSNNTRTWSTWLKRDLIFFVFWKKKSTTMRTTHRDMRQEKGHDSSRPLLHGQAAAWKKSSGAGKNMRGTHVATCFKCTWWLTRAYCVRGRDKFWNSIEFLFGSFRDLILASVDVGTIFWNWIKKVVLNPAAHQLFHWKMQKNGWREVKVRSGSNQAALKSFEVRTTVGHGCFSKFF